MKCGCENYSCSRKKKSIDYSNLAWPNQIWKEPTRLRWDSAALSRRTATLHRSAAGHVRRREGLEKWRPSVASAAHPVVWMAVAAPVAVHFFWLWRRSRPLNNWLRTGSFCCWIWMVMLQNWLVVSTILKNIGQWEGLSHILWKIKNVWNHQPENMWRLV